MKKLVVIEKNTLHFKVCPQCQGVAQGLLVKVGLDPCKKKFKDGVSLLNKACRY